MKKVILKRGKEESLKRFHPWVFSGAIDRIEGNPAEGDLVDVVTPRGELLARGHYQIGSIAVRVLSFSDEPIDRAWWTARLKEAYQVRHTLHLTGSAETTCYRLVHGEGDWMPGLVVDIYGSTAVMQAHSVGIWHMRATIAEILREIYGDSLAAVYDKSSQTVPYMAGLGAEDGYLWHASPEIPSGTEVVLEGGHRFAINWESGQKSGFFIDQRENRALVQRYAAGRDVLNTFSYTGGFSVYALAGGATSVDSVDSSKIATELAERNVELNFGTAATHRAITADAMEFVRSSKQDAYDLIILDPPAFAKHRKALVPATQADRRLHAEALSRIRPGGILFTFSCSQAVERDLFRTTVFSAAAISGRRVRILHQLTQPADHPVSIYHPEGEYLKGLVLFVE